MNWGAFALLAIVISVSLLFVQRSEAKRRRLTTMLTIVIGFLVYYWAGVRGLTREFVTALIVALVFNLVFWLLIGRYNPVKDSDDMIQVIGMDD